MEYPSWYVPLITTPMLIPLIAVVHVIVAQFAVGFGILVADLVKRAYQAKHEPTLACLRDLAKALILISVVFGAITGVGIWWTIGLTSPETTSALIHIFVFGWATEWVMFIVELVSAFVFFYFWGRLPAQRHIAVGWIYAVSAWLSLVLIAGITSFMLTSGSWSPEKGFFAAFFNRSFIPQVVIRTGGALAIATLFIWVLLCFRNYEPEVKDIIVHRTSQWGLGGIILILLGSFAYMAVLPEYVLLNMMRAPILIVMTAIVFSVGGLLLVGFALFCKYGARWINPVSAVLLLLAGMAAIASGEFIREGGRKPHRIEGIVWGPGIFDSQRPQFVAKGFINNARWLRYYLENKLPGFSADRLQEMTPVQRRTVGKAVFRYHCSACHADFGYNAIVPLVWPWNEELISKVIRNLHRANPAMPVCFANPAEQECLTQYLNQLTREGENK